MTNSFDLRAHGITVSEIYRNLPLGALYEHGYTAKVAGTEMGVNKPTATFSPCFGGPFLVWHPSKYAELLSSKIEKHGARARLVNTGWSRGGYGVGERIKLSYTRAIIDAIHSGGLENAKTETDAIFGLEVVTECPGIPSEILIPRNVWRDRKAYKAAAMKLASLFSQNFAKYEEGCGLKFRQRPQLVESKRRQ